jgi:hypothetical protein
VKQTNQPHILTHIIKTYVSASVVRARVKIQHFKLCQSIHGVVVFSTWTFVEARCVCVCETDHEVVFCFFITIT